MAASTWRVRSFTNRVCYLSNSRAISSSSSSSSSTEPFSRFKLPGLNLPLNWTPHEEYGKFDSNYGITDAKFIKVPAEGEGKNLFRTALNDKDVYDGYTSLPLTTLREITMLQIMNALTDKPHWNLKVFDDDIVKKWKDEVLAAKGRDVTQKMVDYVMDELRFKAIAFEKTGAVSLFNGDVIKSDYAIPSSVKEELQSATHRLEDIPDTHKDYHPGSDGKVLDLVHPSLYPLVYGQSRIVDDRLIGLDECTKSCGEGNIIQPRPEETELPNQKQSDPWDISRSPYSRNFQWLPCEVDIAGGNGSVKITSYINNLHPQQHSEIYSSIENVLARTISLWDMTLTPLRDGLYYPRIEYVLEFDPDPDAISWEEKQRMLPRDECESEDDYCIRQEVWENEIRRVVRPEPEPFQPREAEQVQSSLESGTDALRSKTKVDLRRDYGHRGLQVIVKLANIELTPEKPFYEGGTWHVEGQLNEHICATAIYYYNCENITESRLAFRQQSSTDDAWAQSYPQDVHGWLTEIFGCTNNGPAAQEVGSVLCSEGRLITFPNILQHKVEPFGLADPTKKGYRKILALFLVDPNIRIISTANVPPQQKDWWRDEVEKQVSARGEDVAKLSTEIKDKLFEQVEGFSMGMDEAKELRLRLMEERSNHAEEARASFEQHGFNLCEH